LRPFPRYAYKDLNSALPHSSVRCTPAPPNLDTWVSLPPPLASSPCLLSRQISPARPDPRLRGQIQDSESVGSTRYNRDPSPPGRSESDQPACFESSGAIRACTDRSESMSAPVVGLSILPYVPAKLGDSPANSLINQGVMATLQERGITPERVSNPELPCYRRCV
jgi:hypothetical protein